MSICLLVFFNRIVTEDSGLVTEKGLLTRFYKNNQRPLIEKFHYILHKSSSCGLRKSKMKRRKISVRSVRLVQLTISGDEAPTDGSFTLSRTNGH